MNGMNADKTEISAEEFGPIGFVSSRGRQGNNIGRR